MVSVTLELVTVKQGNANYLARGPGTLPGTLPGTPLLFRLLDPPVPCLQSQSEQNPFVLGTVLIILTITGIQYVSEKYVSVVCGRVR